MDSAYERLENRRRKPALTDLPRGTGVSRVENRLRIAAQNSVCPTREHGSKRVFHAARHALPHRPSVGGTQNQSLVSDCDALVAIKKVHTVQNVFCSRHKRRPRRSGISAFQNRAGIANYESNS